MSEFTPNALAAPEAAPEPWHPGGAILGTLIAGVALFFAVSVLTLIGALMLTSLVDVVH